MSKNNKACPITPTKANQGTGTQNIEPKGNKIIDSDEVFVDDILNRQASRKIHQLQKTINNVLMNAYICPNCGFIAIFQNAKKQIPDLRCPFCTNEVMQKIILENPEPIIIAEEAI